MGTLALILLPFLAWPWVASYIWKTKVTYQEVFLHMVAVTLLSMIIWFAGGWAATQDIEKWNGVVQSKDRHHGQYTESYECNCTSSTDSKGNTTTSCQTCYREHYTVTWSADTTVGDITFQHLDRTSRSVYNTPNPPLYTQCEKGQPATISHRYKNWVQAVPESLFSSNEALAKMFEGKIPQPPEVYNFYRYNRIVDPSNIVPKDKEIMMDTILDTALITLGATHQVNIIVVVTDILDPNFKVAVENAWLGGEKNEVIVFIGMKDGAVKWTDTMTWALNAKNADLIVKMNRSLKEVTPGDDMWYEIADKILFNVNKYFVRPEMKDYDYLEDAIQPANWLIITLLIVQVLVSGFLTWLFMNYEVDIFGGGFRRNSSRFVGGGSRWVTGRRRK